MPTTYSVAEEKRADLSGKTQCVITCNHLLGLTELECVGKHRGEVYMKKRGRDHRLQRERVNSYYN